MADTLTPGLAPGLARTHPLASRLDALDRLPLGFRVRVDPFKAMTNVRLPQPERQPSHEALDALSGALGVRPPMAPNTWVPVDQGPVPGQIIWLGPHEWLLTTHHPQPHVQEAELRTALVPHGGAAVDVSAQRVTLTLFGPHLRDVLAHGCALDLHRRVFRPGTCAQTLLGRAGVILLADADPESMTVLVRQSFAPYLADWLCDAAQEFRV